jgi:Uri superfamily endonuclease
MYIRPGEDWEIIVANNSGLISYQLIIEVTKSQNILIGQLGRFDFPVGRYVYTGSARRNLPARVRRHLKSNKMPRWHVDYLLNSKDVHVMGLNFSSHMECVLNQSCNGEILMPGFGASDCRHQCRSHLKYLGVAS